MSDRSFVVDWKLATFKAYTTSVDESELWHRRMGNFNYRSLSQLSEIDLVENLSKMVEHVDFCEVCQLGKQSRFSFPANKAWRATEKLHLVHTDVYGTMRTQSLSGIRYFILFIDDCTRFCWVYFLKIKSEVAHVFWKFKSQLKLKPAASSRSSDMTMGLNTPQGCLRSFVKIQGLNTSSLTLTTQQNGVNERENRNVMDMARCFMLERNVPRSFSAEFVNTTVYLQNRLPTKSMKEETLFEAWFGF